MNQARRLFLVSEQIICEKVVVCNLKVHLLYTQEFDFVAKPSKSYT